MPISGCSKISVQAAGHTSAVYTMVGFRRLIEQEAEDAAGYDDGDGTDFAEE